MKHILVTTLKIGSITIAILLIALVIFYFWASSGGYPRNKYAEIVEYAATPPPAQDEFTVVTYNIGYLSGLTNNKPVAPARSLFNENLKTAVSALKPLNPDFIGLQEIDVGSKRSFKINQVAELAKILSLGRGAIAINWDKNYVPFPYLPFSAHFGQILSAQAVLSRYPIESQKRIVLDKVANKPFFYKAFYLDRLTQVTQINVNGRPLILINVHLEAFDIPTRRKQTQFLAQLLPAYVTKYPVLLVGDFNSTIPSTTEPDPTINILLNTPKIKSALPNSIATFPSDNPEAKLDYIFYTPDTIEVLEWKIVADAKTASDHLPLMIKFRLRR